MSQDVFERAKHRWGANGQGDVDQEQLKRSAAGISLSPISVESKAHSGALVEPEVHPRGRDRRSRRDAQEEQRELGAIVRTARKIALMQDAVRAINTHVVYTIDQGQEEMTDVLYSKTRHEGMNELLAEVISQSLQQMVAQNLALAELHFKRQTENQ